MNDWDQIADILREMSSSGYDFMVGPHAPGMIGYYACFYQADDMPWCEACDNPRTSWDDSGHAESPLEAVEMARAIALGLSVEIPSAESFLP